MWLGIPVLVIVRIRQYTFSKPYLPSSPNGWLAIIGIAWLAILLLGILRTSKPDEGRWIAGTLEFSPHRFWVLALFVPFIPALFFTASPWTEDIYAAHWA